MRILVTSAGKANGNGYGAVLVFDRDGQLTGPFSGDPRITDPRGMAVDPSGQIVYLNSGDDRMLALDLLGNVVRDSGPIPGLDPGGAEFAPDGRYCVTLRRRRAILAMDPVLDQPGELLVPEGIVQFPRGFGFGTGGTAGRLYLSSGVAPSGQGDNTIVVFDRPGGSPRTLVTDPGLSPLDLKIAPNGNIVVASQSPFGVDDPVVSVREYDPVSGRLVRVFSPARTVGFRTPRGLRFGPDGHLYCVGKDMVVAFDFGTGDFIGHVLIHARLNGQALVFLP
jgi:DNA-binding beta-propeller fold protein YncE